MSPVTTVVEVAAGGHVAGLRPQPLREVAERRLRRSRRPGLCAHHPLQVYHSIGRTVCLRWLGGTPYRWSAKPISFENTGPAVMPPPAFAIFGAWMTT